MHKISTYVSLIFHLDIDLLLYMQLNLEYFAFDSQVCNFFLPTDLSCERCERGFTFISFVATLSAGNLWFLSSVEVPGLFDIFIILLDVEGFGLVKIEDGTHLDVLAM